MIHCVPFTSSFYARKRIWLWKTPWSSTIYFSLICHSLTPLSSILGNVVHPASPWGKQHQMVNVSAVGDSPTKSPRHKNLIQYNCAPNSGLCACAVCRGCFSLKKRVCETPRSRTCGDGEVEWGHALEKQLSLWVLGSGIQEQWEQKWLGIGISVIKEIPMVSNKAYSKTEQNAKILPSIQCLMGFDYCGSIENKDCFNICVLYLQNFQIN